MRGSFENSPIHQAVAIQTCANRLKWELRPKNFGVGDSGAATPGEAPLKKNHDGPARTALKGNASWRRPSSARLELDHRE